MASKRVAVIGAGAAGLVTLRHLSADANNFTVVAFEMTSDVGGTWVYNYDVSDEQNDTHSSIYQNLVTNLPKEVMAFPDYPFPDHLPSFLHHTEIRNYLISYAKHFNLFQYIQFNTKVDHVTRSVDENGAVTWLVTTSDVIDRGQQPVQNSFDVVIVCNGHYSIPYMPDIQDIDLFRGSVLHSHQYRRPDAYQGQTVAILGAAASGRDIALDVSAVAKHVYLLHRKELQATSLPSNVSCGCGISRMSAHHAILDDGTRLEIDSLILCTGYKYNFPFLSPSCEVNLCEERVTPLYKHIIHSKHHTLAFIGLCKGICPFPQFHCQVQFYLAALSGAMVLPSTEEMNLTIERECHSLTSARDRPARFAHNLRETQWEYNDELAHLAGFTPVPRWLRLMYEYVHYIRVRDLVGFKRLTFEMVKDDEFRVKDTDS